MVTEVDILHVKGKCVDEVGVATSSLFKSH